MKKLSTLIWLAIIIAIIPLLALPLWLMKALITGLALIIALIGYSVFRDQDTDEDIHIDTPPQDFASAEELPEEEPEKSQPQLETEPVDVTDPDADRFVATNSYERRRNINKVD